jgi:aminopeptidase N
MQIIKYSRTIPLAAAMTAAAMTVASPVCNAFSPSDAPGRLPKDVVPISYRIAIVPDVAGLKFTGRETVALQVLKATDKIQFNSLNEVLKDVRLDGKPVQGVVSNNDAQLTTVTLRAPAAPGSHSLTFAYSGKIESEPHGLFAQPYLGAGGVSGLLLSTQMEATDARRMFPCWDEPAFRATFALTATVPAGWATVSNMPVATRVVKGKLATVSFGASPKMPSYLVEFTAGNLSKIAATSGGTQFGVWAVSGVEQEGTTALANAQVILADYNDYFGYPYPLPKLDSIAVPGGFQGAMENWGAITYNDQTLLLSPGSAIKDRQLVYEIQAHEMAHQWNGDLVTMAWWDDIWLNESFASWMAAKETDRRNPDWKWWEAQDADKERAMRADARATSHAIQQHVTDELQATNSFDSEITYNKGQGILRMFEAYLGPDTFRAGIRGYMQQFAFSNATTSDLWNALSKASGTDVGAIVSDWTAHPGFPVVNVAATCGAGGARTLTLSQRRFLLLPDDAVKGSWKIPLQIRSGVDAAPKAVLLTDNDQKVVAGRCDEPLSIDAGALGFYRARYEPAILDVDTKNFARLPDADRIALLDDQWALVETGVEPLPTYLKLAASMGSSLDSRAWEQIVGALAVIEFDERGDPGHDAFAAYAAKILAPAFDELGWDARPNETPDRLNLRQSIIENLGGYGDQRIIDGARERFAKFLKDRSAIAPDSQAAILAVVAQHADAATFDSLHALARTAKDETELRRYYSALMAVRDPALAQRAADIALSGDIPAQADAFRVQLIVHLAAENPTLSWRVFQDNNERLLKPFVMSGPIIVAQYVPAAYWSAVPPAEIEAWVRAHVPPEMGPNVDRGMETLHFRVAEKERLVRAADAYLHS